MSAAPQLHAGAAHPISIGIGELKWSCDPNETYTTVLGSCVGVALWDPIARTGGLSHFLLARAPVGENDDTRYGNIALPQLKERLCAAGAQDDRLRAVVAGGADLLSYMRSIGTENTEFVRRWLQREEIFVEHFDCGGQLARRVLFEPTNGAFEVTVVRDGD